MTLANDIQPLIIIAESLCGRGFIFTSSKIYFLVHRRISGGLKQL